MKIITENSVTLFDNMVPVIVSNTHPFFEEVKSLAELDALDEALELADPRRAVQTSVKDTSFNLVNDTLYYDNYRVPQNLAERILDLMRIKAPITALENFIKNLLENPSFRAVQELYGFLEVAKLPITEDGHFMAYKSVSSNFKDLFSGTMDNSIGAQPTMPRNTVDEDKNRTCSQGLHFAAYEYAKGFGYGDSHLMAVKVNPKDVVAIPSDYNNQKGRACTYLIADEIISKQDTLQDTPLYIMPTTETESH